jgi:hypothetical protein
MYLFPSYLLEPVARQDLLMQEEHFRKLTVRMSAYLLACTGRQLHTLNKDTNGFQGK